MRLALLVATLAAAIGCTSNAHVTEARIARGVPLVPATIDGRQTWCVLDTGQPNFVVSPVFGGVPWLGLGDPTPLDIREMQVANWYFSGQAITLSEASFASWEQRLGVDGIDCVLGIAFLWGLQVTVDYAGERVEILTDIGRPMRAAGTLGEDHVDTALSAEWYYVGNVELGDSYTGILAFDTGEGLVTLTPRAWGDLEAAPPLEGDRGRVPAVEVAGSRLEDVPAVVDEPGQLAALEQAVGLEVDGLLGASFLAGHAVTWDLQAGTVLLRPYEEGLRDEVLGALAQELAR